MRHMNGFKQLNRTNAERRALYRNMVEALYKNERIQTTTVKAKEVRRVAEKLITRAKEKSLHNIRIIARFIKNKAVLMKLFDEIAPRYVTRNGGYTRIIKLARRKGDGADMSYLELIEEQSVVKKKKKKKKLNKEDLKQSEKAQAEKIEKNAEKETKKEEESIGKIEDKEDKVEEEQESKVKVKESENSDVNDNKEAMEDK